MRGNIIEVELHVYRIMEEPVGYMFQPQTIFFFVWQLVMQYQLITMTRLVIQC